MANYTLVYVRDLEITGEEIDIMTTMNGEMRPDREYSEKYHPKQRT